ncbi:MAG TPA: DNA primase [Bryobacteraceae bacterium]|jgi:DNA primase|nr:DNA primase [Bryobacteraceae bacterium]
MDFREQLKSTADIVSVVGDYVRLRKSSAYRYTGLCPFHSEKTPSFSVHASKQFYHCFGCHKHGDVLQFVMEIEGVSFYEALKSLAERYGLAMPKRSQYADEDSRKRAALLQMHELAQENFQANLRGSTGEAARAYLAKRGAAGETIEQFGLGYADRSGRALVRLFEQRGMTPELIEESGLVGKRPDGSFYDRFRNRLMFPIHNERGGIIGYGGRALAAEDEPKYLNSPETPIYKKSHVLYNLHRAKDAIRKEDRVILVEGYMDAIGVTAAGFGPVVASCGTALTSQQVQIIKRHSQHIAVNFDPDAPGAAAAQRSIGLLLDEGMFVKIMELDGDLDPDEYCKERGPEAYRERLEAAKGYFYWLADRARAKHDVRTTEGVVAVLQTLVPAVQRISDRVERMAVAENLAGYIGVERGVVLESFRKTIGDRQEKTIERPKENIRADEKGLIHVLLSDIEGRSSILSELEKVEILARLPTTGIFQAICAVFASGSDVTFDVVNARLEESDRTLLAEVLFSEEVPGHEMNSEYGNRCLGTLRQSDEQARRSELKAQVKQAERAGDVREALRLTQELAQIERRNATRI